MVVMDPVYKHIGVEGAQELNSMVVMDPIYKHIDADEGAEQLNSMIVEDPIYRHVDVDAGAQELNSMVVMDPIYKHIGVEGAQELNSMVVMDPIYKHIDTAEGAQQLDSTIVEEQASYKHDDSTQLNLLPQSSHSKHYMFSLITFGLYSSACLAALIGTYCAFFGQFKHKNSKDVSVGR
jgi:hypothetical protein